MPLLYRKPFSPEKVPEDLKPDEEIFVCRHTNEVFRDYELFFKRTILCNSLVWSCKFTGKSGLTYQEALESERGLISDGMSLPEPIQRAILTLVHHTHRGRLVNLCDEVYCYTKDRYQEGEIVKFQLNGKKRKGTVLRVIEPNNDVATGHSKSPKSKKSSEKLLSPKMKKVLEENSSPSKRSLHSSKKKNTTEQKPATPKSKRSGSEDNLVSPKNRKHSNSSEKLKSPKMSKSPNRKNVIVIDDGDGENCSKNKREESVFKFPVNGTNDKDQNESLWPDATLYHYEIRVTPIKFLKKKEGKKDKDEIVILPASEVSRKKGVVTRDRLKLFLKATCMRSTPSSEEGYWIVQEEYRKKFDLGDLDPDVQLLLTSPPTGKKSRKRKVDGSQSDIISQSADDMPKKKQKRKSDEKEAELLKNKERKEKQFEIKKSKLTPEERQRLLDEEKEKRKQAIEEEKEKRKQQKEIEKAQKEEEKMKRKLERDKEREKLKEKKRMEALLLKEWSKPREDLELDDLKSLPEPEPVKTKVPLDMFGDAVMVVEFLNAFGHLFDIKDEFPSGFTFALLEDALYEHDAEGVYYDLMQFLLGAILRTHLEEEEDEGLAGNQHIKPPSDYDGEDNHHAAVSASATMAAAWSMLHQGKQLHELIMDPFTCSELLRLHLLSSGVRIGCEDEEFRWQSRGGFTFSDDVVVEFRHKEPAIIRQLLTTCVYDMEPQDKLKILLALSGQLMTYSTTRDFMEECFDKCKKARRDWQDDQWREQRQEREEAAARYKKRMEERAKQKEELEKKKKEKEQGEEKKSGTLQNGTSNETKDGEKQQEQKSKENKRRQKRDNSEEENKNKDERAKGAARDVKEGEHGETAAVTKEEEEEQARVRKVEKKKKEQEYLEALRHTSAASNIQPLGRDRLFRRYWVFQSLKGLFVEDNDPNLPLFLASEQDMKESTGLQADVQDKKQLAVSDDQLIKNESKSSGHVTPQNTDTPDDKLPTVKSGGVLVNGDVTLLSKTTKCDPAIAKILKTNKILLSDLPSHGLNQLVSDTENLDSKSIYRNRNILKWGFFKTQEELDSLLSTLNPRGLREKSLREALQLEYDMIVKAIEKCPFRTEENLKKESFKTKQKKGGNRAQVAVDKSRYQTMEAFLEANLRDQILDIEDRIWQGSLGCIKVSDREAWRNKVENGIYHILSSTHNTTETLNGQEEPMEVDGKIKCEKDICVSENAGSGDVSCAFKEDLMDNRSHVLANSVTNGTLGKPHVDSDDTEVEQIEKNRIFKVEELTPASSVPSRLELTKTQQNACLLGSRSATPTNGTTSLFVDPVTKELAHALLKVEQGIEAKFLAPPLGEDEDTKKEKQREDTVSEKKERKEKKENKKDKENEKERNQGETADDKDNKQEEVNDDCSSNSSDEPVKQHKTVLERWEESLLACTSFSQVFVHLNTLDQSITWSKSVLNARCRLCRRKGDAEHMLLCDGCDRGHHMYCLKPPITEIPEGDWFCNDCRPKEPRRSERRRKPVIEEDDEEDSGEEDDTEEYDVEEESDDESDSDFDEDDESVVQEEEQSEAESEHGDTCAFCGEVGELLCCETCPLAYHLSCAYPPLRRIPRGNWACQVCTGADEDLPRGRRVKKAIIKAAEKRARPIQSGKSAKSKRQTRAKRPEKKNTKVRVGLESSRDSSVEGRRKTKRRKISASSSSRCSTPEPRRSCTAIKIRGRASLDSKARDPKLNSRLSKCEKLLKELSSVEEAEYFMEPVDAVKHPDYHQFVKDPIDFGTIQKNLAQRAYDSVEDFAADVRRVFINCSEYFRPRAKEARAGIKLSASFETMFSDMGLDSSSIPTTRSRRN